jgi:hypothetical protein
MYRSFDAEDVAADYLQLLRRGSVMRRLALAEHDGWRRAIRTTARSDEIHVRTWSRPGTPAEVWAVLPDWSLARADFEQLQRRLTWLRED